MWCGRMSSSQVATIILWSLMALAYSRTKHRNRGVLRNRLVHQPEAAAAEELWRDQWVMVNFLISSTFFFSHLTHHTHAKCRFLLSRTMFIHSFLPLLANRSTLLALQRGTILLRTSPSQPSLLISRNWAKRRSSWGWVPTLGYILCDSMLISGKVARSWFDFSARRQRRVSWVTSVEIVSSFMEANSDCRQKSTASYIYGLRFFTYASISLQFRRWWQQLLVFCCARVSPTEAQRCCKTSYRAIWWCCISKAQLDQSKGKPLTYYGASGHYNSYDRTPRLYSPKHPQGRYTALPLRTCTYSSNQAILSLMILTTKGRTLGYKIRRLRRNQRLNWS